MIDLFGKRHKLVHNGRFPTFVTGYNLLDHKASSQLKSYEGFPLYPPLWTSQLVAMYDEIKNTSISDESSSGVVC